jgi:hypothetical protein
MIHLNSTDFILCYGLYDPEFESRQKTKDFPFLQNVKTGSRAQPAFNSMGAGGSFHGCKAAGA